VKYNHTEVTAALKTCLIITNTQNLTATQVASQQGAATGLIKAFEKKYVWKQKGYAHIKISDVGHMLCQDSSVYITLYV